MGEEGDGEECVWEGLLVSVPRRTRIRRPQPAQRPASIRPDPPAPRCLDGGKGPASATKPALPSTPSCAGPSPPSGGCPSPSPRAQPGALLLNPFIFLSAILSAKPLLVRYTPAMPSPPMHSRHASGARNHLNRHVEISASLTHFIPLAHTTRASTASLFNFQGDRPWRSPKASDERETKTGRHRTILGIPTLLCVTVHSART